MATQQQQCQLFLNTTIMNFLMLPLVVQQCFVTYSQCLYACNAVMQPLLWLSPPSQLSTIKGRYYLTCRISTSDVFKTTQAFSNSISSIELRPLSCKTTVVWTINFLLTSTSFPICYNQLLYHPLFSKTGISSMLKD